MPDFKPTLATAFIYADIGLVTASTDREWKDDPGGVPCLILPAPVPIEQCPEEWKDGRRVWLYVKWEERVDDGWWIPAYYKKDCLYWMDGHGVKISPRDEITHVMLPPPAPEQKGGAR